MAIKLEEIKLNIEKGVFTFGSEEPVDSDKLLTALQVGKQYIELVEALEVFAEFFRIFHKTDCFYVSEKLNKVLANPNYIDEIIKPYTREGIKKWRH